MRMSQSCVVACGGTVPKIMSLFHVTRKFQSLEDREGFAKTTKTCQLQKCWNGW